MKYRKHEAKEYANTVLKGVWTALPYNFTADDRLDEAGIAANLDRSDPVRGADELSGVAGCRQKRVARSHAIGDQQTELHRVVTFTQVTAISDPDP